MPKVEPGLWTGFPLGDSRTRLEAGFHRGNRPNQPDADFPLAAGAVLPRVGASMIAPETFSHIDNIKKRAGYLWRFL